MKVLALVPNVLGFSPGQRSSIEVWEQVLGPAGIDIDYAAFENDALHSILYEPGRHGLKALRMMQAYLARAGVVKKADGYDAVLIYREAALLGPAFYERLIGRRGIPIIYQLDDPLHIRYRSHTNNWLSYLKFPSKVRTNCRLASVVIVNSPALYGFASQHNPNVWQIPSLVDADAYTYEEKDYSDRRICIGWSGSPSTASNLTLVAEPLHQLANRVDYDLHLIGSPTFNLPGLRYTSQEWHPETEVEDLRRIDIGLVPVPDNPWNRWKFFMKVAQYMALGIPPVATPAGSIPQDIDHGIDGLLSSTTEDWVSNLERLIVDRDLLAEMSRNAAKKARDRFTLQSNASKIIEAFRSASPTAR